MTRLGDNKQENLVVSFLFLLALTVFLFFTLFSFGFFVKVFFTLSFLFFT